ncbi:glycosyltransferase [Thiocapsa marina]|uniref:Glycosyl transferase, group 1 n=1 Tax=Thiocapsa marina 5811 TaxID=768671 RepID=F9U6Z1_9GAMM|nr:glycosyltransferase [Thiocapsa marina]EGV20017.1 glycosyl transferase, group 1 [Thiocapsa marina 5811]
METDKKIRVMWLLNHSAARRFEIAMLNRVGISEIFLPKRFPNDISFRSASVDDSLDASLTIPADELAILNAADWYGRPGRDAWAIANRYFDVLFFIVHKPEILEEISRHFQGVALLRAYGQFSSMNYTRILHWYSRGRATVETMGGRFYFAVAYEHLPKAEDSFLRSRALFLPLGMSDPEPRADEWRGSEPTVMFVCPDLAFNEYYRRIYDDFVADFGDLPYKIAGAQPLHFQDPKVLGYLPADAYARSMRELRVMYYQSREPNHVHYHPFEAVRLGMPLVFMSGGMLDRLGGLGLPGRCETTTEARAKLQAILSGDAVLIEEIRKSQLRLIELMHPDRCEPFWRQGFVRIAADIEAGRAEDARRPLSYSGPRRIAVILPLAYRGGTLRAAKLVAEALLEGSRAAGELADIVLAYPDDPHYDDDVLGDLPRPIARRRFRWRVLDADSARRAMRFQGHAWDPGSEQYLVPDDGIRQFADCDLWLFISDRVSKPLLPIRPYITVVFDYLQRYFDVIDPSVNIAFLRFVREAQRVLVTTHSTESDAKQYAGITAEKLYRVPMLMPRLGKIPNFAQNKEREPYFIWTTNASPHKNHLNAIIALRMYYDELGGSLRCKVTGLLSSDWLHEPQNDYQKRAATIAERNSCLRENIDWSGEISEKAYGEALAGAVFLWHPARQDNGTFSVLEAAQLGVPSLSSDYPAMREIDAQFSLGLNWMDASDTADMARQLKRMETHTDEAVAGLPSAEQLLEQNSPRLAGQYWAAVRECL